MSTSRVPDSAYPVWHCSALERLSAVNKALPLEVDDSETNALLQIDQSILRPVRWVRFVEDLSVKGDPHVALPRTTYDRHVLERQHNSCAMPKRGDRNVEENAHASNGLQGRCFLDSRRERHLSAEATTGSSTGSAPDGIQDSLAITTLEDSSNEGDDDCRAIAFFKLARPGTPFPRFAELAGHDEQPVRLRALVTDTDYVRSNEFAKPEDCLLGF